ncbi:MAG: hypothetical protein WA071_26615 [Undibacterium umbellatum]|jgi:hypothetical protein|uniref:hypothetical protein n=1 Tax=Undibacterium umbellatum TaxID=2762300 RepID=UPI003BB6321D
MLGRSLTHTSERNCINMKLLSIREIQSGLDKEFLPLEPMLSGYRIVEKVLSERIIAETETILKVKFPVEFRIIISAIDFGRLTIGPIVFCARGDYMQELIELNTSVCWWEGMLRPSDFIMIGNSDPFAILLNVKTGRVLAMDSEAAFVSDRIIAENFQSFFCGVGTAILMKNDISDRRNLAKCISDCVKCDDIEFWSGLTH